MTPAKDVDAYIAAAPAEARQVLAEVRALITSSIPGVEEGISYAVPFYKLHGPVAGFAVYTHHVSVGFGGAVLGTEDRAALEAKGYKTGKQTVQVGFDQPVPAAAMKRLFKAKAKANAADAR